MSKTEHTKLFLYSDFAFATKSCPPKGSLAIHPHPLYSYHVLQLQLLVVQLSKACEGWGQRSSAAKPTEQYTAIKKEFPAWELARPEKGVLPKQEWGAPAPM